MDHNATSPMLFRSRIDIINTQTNETMCLLRPNPYQNAHVQFWVNPVTKQATLKVDGVPLTEQVQRQVISVLSSHELNEFINLHKNTTDHLGKIVEGIESGQSEFNNHIKINTDTISIQQKIGPGKYDLKTDAKIHNNYRNNGPALTTPNLDSPHRPGTRKYRPNTSQISSGEVQATRKTVRALQGIGGPIKGMGKILKPVGWAADAGEFGQHINAGEYDKAVGKAAEVGGGVYGARVGAGAGAKLGLRIATAVPHPLGKIAAIALCTIGGGIAGAFGVGKFTGSVGEEWYRLATKQAPEIFETFPTDINNDQFNIHLDSKRMFDKNGDIIGYSVRNGKAEPLRKSDLGPEP